MEIEVSVTVNGVQYDVTVGGRRSMPRADGTPAVAISAGGVWVGSGWWGGRRIEECPADLPEEAYAELDSAIASAIEQAFRGEWRRVFGADARVLSWSTSEVIATAGWPHPASYDPAKALAVLQGRADGDGETAEGDAAVCRALEEAGAFRGFC